MASGDSQSTGRIAIIGAGYVADLYMSSLCAFPELEVVGVWDRDASRLAHFAAHWSLPALAGFEAVVEARPDIVLNLTNPASHAAVTRDALEAGFHVWSEKPLALDMDEAVALTALAKERGLHLASAPCSVLGRAAQTLWRAVRDGRVGRPRLV